MNIFALPSVGPFCGVQKDRVITFPNKRSFRVVLYGAYNARGLYGSENNGIAILDEEEHTVVVDMIGAIDSGYYGASKGQVALWEKLTTMKWPSFKKFVNGQRRLRLAI